MIYHGLLPAQQGRGPVFGRLRTTQATPAVSAAVTDVFYDYTRHPVHLDAPYDKDEAAYRIECVAGGREIRKARGPHLIDHEGTYRISHRITLISSPEAYRPWAPWALPLSSLTPLCMASGSTLEDTVK
jgi:hypothetical protein